MRLLEGSERSCMLLRQSSPRRLAYTLSRRQGASTRSRFATSSTKLISSRERLSPHKRATRQSRTLPPPSLLGNSPCDPGGLNALTENVDFRGTAKADRIPCRIAVSTHRTFSEVIKWSVSMQGTQHLVFVPDFHPIAIAVVLLICVVVVWIIARSFRSR